MKKITSRHLACAAEGFIGYSFYRGDRYVEASQRANCARGFFALFRVKGDEVCGVIIETHHGNGAVL